MAYVLLTIGIILLFFLTILNIQTEAYEIAAAYGISGTALFVFTGIYLFAIKTANKNVSRDLLLEKIIENEDEVLTYGS
jgi:K+ transporter